MDRKFKVNDSAGEDASGDNPRSKEEALDKLRKMEWKRNTQDTWHLARSNSRGNEVRERKKYNKDEDNYFEGTGVQKTKKIRKPRPPEDFRTVPSGFSAPQASAAPPVVNAWSQKKGSDLFQREEEIDEEDQVLRLAILESLRSAEEDEKRRIERFKMTNLELATSTQTMSAEKDWQDEYVKEEFYSKPNPVGFQEDTPKADLHFVETDLKEETPTVNQRHRSIPPRSRKTSSQEKSSLSPGNKNFDFSESERKVASSVASRNVYSKEGKEKSPQVTGNEPDDDDGDYFEPSRPQANYEPSRPQTNYSKPRDKVYETTSSLASSVTPPPKSSTMHRSSAKHPNINLDNLSTSFNSGLTFGETQGLFEKIQGDGKYHQTSGHQNIEAKIPTYLTNATDNNSSQIKPRNPGEPSETDILLHSFIRHEPPPNQNFSEQTGAPDMTAIRQRESNDLFPMATSHAYLGQDLHPTQCFPTHQVGDTEQHPATNGLVSGALPAGIQISNGRDSSSSISGSPLQTITPYGSLENEIPSSVRAAVPAPSQIGNVPYQYPYGVVENNQDTLSRHLQTLQLMNQNMSPIINREYSPVTTQIRGIVPINPQVGQPQFSLPNSNIMMPSFQGQAMPPLLQHQLQQAHLQQMQVPPGYLPHLLSLNAMRLQQSHLATGIAEPDNNAMKEPENMNQPSQSQVQSSHQTHPSQAHALTQNQQNVLLQNHPQIMSMQSQSQSLESTSPNQEELLQQHVLQGARAQVGKTQEELQIEYQNAIQALRRVQEQIQEQAVQAVAAAQVPASAPPPQAQLPWGMMSSSPTMPMPMSQFFPVPMISQVHPHLIQQQQNAGLISPTIQHTPQNLTGLMNIGPEMSLGPEINAAQESAQISTELNTGRGRGRLN